MQVKTTSQPKVRQLWWPLSGFFAYYHTKGTFGPCPHSRKWEFKSKNKKTTLKLLNQKSSDQHLPGPLTLLIVMSLLQTEIHIALGQLFCLLDSTCFEYVLLTNEQFKVGTGTEKQTSDKQKTQNVLRLSTVVHTAARFLQICHLKPGYSPSTVLDLSKKGDWPISPYRIANIRTNKG